MEYSSIVNIQLVDEVPERAVLFLDSLCASYIRYSVQNQIEVNSRTVRYIEDQLEYVVDLIEEIDVKLDVYREYKPVLLLTNEDELFFGQLVDYEAKKRSLLLRIEQIHDLQNYILNSDDERVIPPAFYIGEGDQFLESSLQELYDLQFKRNEMLFQVKPVGTGIENYDESLNLLRKDILTYLVNTISAIEEQVETLNNEIMKLETMIRGLPKNLREKITLERKKRDQ